MKTSPDTTHIVSFSGGLGSFWAAYRVLQRYGPANVTLLFADTMMEDEDLYRFLDEASEYLGVAITRIADGRTPWEVFRDERFLGNPRADLCSRILKRDLLNGWIEENYAGKPFTLYLGIDWTEEHRLRNVRQRLQDWSVDAPMCESPFWDKAKMIRETEILGIVPPRLYSMGFPHNNCGGFCVKAGQAHFAHLLRVMPERYAEHEAKEQEIREELGDVAILRDRRGGKTKPLTLKALRERVVAGEEFASLDWGGCGCAIE